MKNLEGLEKNFRVKHLYAQKNRISCIRGVIEKLKHLETLSLYDNELRDLEDVLGTLKILSSLKCLGISFCKFRTVR
jgi:Leucine-rich repeat (LRR) protein